MAERHRWSDEHCFDLHDPLDVASLRPPICFGRDRHEPDSYRNGPHCTLIVVRRPVVGHPGNACRRGRLVALGGAFRISTRTEAMGDMTPERLHRIRAVHEAAWALPTL